MKHLVDSVEALCLDDGERERQTPMWKVNINGQSYKNLIRPRGIDNLAEECRDECPAATSCSTVH